MDNIYKSMQNQLPLFSLREINDINIIVTSINNSINLEIHTANDSIICNKLTIALVLILHELPELIIDTRSFKVNKSVLHIFPLYEELKNEFQVIPKVDFDQYVQTIHTSKRDWSAPDLILINTDYETMCNIHSFPSNKVSLYFLSMTIMQIKSHFYNKNIRNNKIERGYILSLLANLFGYNTIGEAKDKESQFSVKIDSLFS